MGVVLNWLNANTGALVAAILAVLTVGAYQQGQIQTQNSIIIDEIQNVATKDDLGLVREGVNRRIDTLALSIDGLRIAVERDQADLKSMIIAAGAANPESVFYAAVIDESLWVFPEVSNTARRLNKLVTRLSFLRNMSAAIV